MNFKTFQAGQTALPKHNNVFSNVCYVQCDENLEKKTRCIIKVDETQITLRGKNMIIVEIQNIKSKVNNVYMKALNTHTYINLRFST